MGSLGLAVDGEVALGQKRMGRLLGEDGPRGGLEARRI